MGDSWNKKTYFITYEEAQELKPILEFIGEGGAGADSDTRSRAKNIANELKRVRHVENRTFRGHQLILNLGDAKLFDTVLDSKGWDLKG